MNLKQFNKSVKDIAKYYNVSLEDIILDFGGLSFDDYKEGKLILGIIPKQIKKGK